MGHVGDKVFLVFLHFIQLVGHVIQCVGEITHFIMGFHINAVVQISGSVFIGSHSNLTKRKEYGGGENQKDNEGQAEHHSRGNVEQVQNIGLGVGYKAGGQVNQHIAVGVVVAGNGC